MTRRTRPSGGLMCLVAGSSPVPNARPDDIKPEFVKKSKVVIIISRYKRVTALTLRGEVVVGNHAGFLVLFFSFQGGVVVRPTPLFSNHEHPDCCVFFRQKEEVAAERA